MADDMSNSAYKRKSEDIKYGFDYSNETLASELWAVYYASVEEVDVWIGRILSVLEEQGIRDDTLVVFLSDHGDLLGEHGGIGKGNMYEAAARVALLLADGGNDIPSGTIVKEPVSLIDLVSTILFYLGATQLDDTDGRSLHRFIADPGKSCIRQE